jgi:hypothetical protein
VRRQVRPLPAWQLRGNNFLICSFYATGAWFFFRRARKTVHNLFFRTCTDNRGDYCVFTSAAVIASPTAFAFARWLSSMR